MYPISRWLTVAAVFILLGLFASGAAYGANASGYCYLDGETNHAGTKVDFYRYPLGEICYTTSTNSSGYYSQSAMLAGDYDVIFSHSCFIPDGLANVHIEGSTSLPPCTLYHAYCEDLDWHEYPYVPPGTSIWFPEDEGKHDPATTYPKEWWYVNFHLTGRTTGREYGAFVAVFKMKIPPLPVGFARLFSISDLYQQQNYTHADLPGILIASATELDLHYTDEIGDPDIWRNMTYVAADLVCEGDLMPFTYRLAVDAIAREDGNPMRLDIIMSSSKAPMMVGGDGLVEIGDGWSYYYSHTKVKVLDESEITVHGVTEKIAGFAWIDHQWGNFGLTEQLTWEWLSIKLDDLRELMVADVWVNGQPQGGYSGGFNLFSDDCSLELSEEYTITPLDDWTDPVSDSTFITQWRIEEVSRDIDLIVTADYDNQMMQVDMFEVFPLGCFWEGVCSVTGTIEGMPVSGKAFAELTHSRVRPCITWFVNPDGTGDFTTIQEAIDEARDCDTIELYDTTFTGDGNWDIDFLGKAIVVRSQSGNPDSCIIDCHDGATPHRGFLFQNEEGPASRLEGITVVEGWADQEYGGGIYCSFSSPIIRNCKIMDCHAGYDGGGICSWISSPTVENCTIIGNSTSDAGGGMFCYLSSPTMTGCTFTGNEAGGQGGGGLAVRASECIINSCTFSGNDAGYGGAIYNVAIEATGSNVDLYHSILWGDCADVQGDEVYNISSVYPGSLIFHCCDVDTSKLSGSGDYWFAPPNINADPVFCDPRPCESVPTVEGDYRICEVSPCLPENSPAGCDLIGAREQGCDFSGDCNGDGAVDSGDIVCLIGCVFLGQTCPDPWQEGDVNCDGIIDAGDIVYLINYVFLGGPPPCCYCLE